MPKLGTKLRMRPSEAKTRKPTDLAAQQIRGLADKSFAVLPRTADALRELGWDVRGLVLTQNTEALFDGARQLTGTIFGVRLA
jgi:hypothetical protein